MIDPIDVKLVSSALVEYWVNYAILTFDLANALYIGF